MWSSPLRPWLEWSGSGSRLSEPASVTDWAEERRTAGKGLWESRGLPRVMENASVPTLWRGRGKGKGTSRGLLSAGWGNVLRSRGR